MLKIYHNNLCSKSCAVLDLLNQKGLDPTIQEYMNDVPSQEELMHLTELLNIKPIELIRKNEMIFKENFEDKKLTDDQWIEVMVQNPILIERPIILFEGKALIGRPIEKVIEFLSKI